ncbi:MULTISPECIES: hypothetical protein [unclassified Caballeronia]|uniref:shikimate dehydrogenase family protein n=1 Tax=unclassified Caballeronia TaxID=2646786 RepID=UPI00285B4CBD|nr:MULTISPECIES: hypothetical protein [unclassified Caballeronia]MDR5752459.1 hypothetical protein [Caballeronia sp. LZ024]MDR5845265.1 hypothetical protein [Caballeronia sp. LZ031]
MLVVGAGEGGQAVAAALALRGVGHLAIHNRSAHRAVELAAQLKPRFGQAIEVAASADAAGYDLIVKCTSQGLKLKPDDALPFDLTRVDAGAAVVEIIMTRELTPLLWACAELGIAAHPGFEMLIHGAGISSFLRADRCRRALAGRPVGSACAAKPEMMTGSTR